MDATLRIPPVAALCERRQLLLAFHKSESGNHPSAIFRPVSPCGLFQGLEQCPGAFSLRLRSGQASLEKPENHHAYENQSC
jgi:hypothetical protein